MTKEQIERLGEAVKRADTVVADDDLGWSYQQLADALPRLLEERQRLLEAARTGLRIGMQRDTSPSAPDEDCARIVAAIAFAEEEAK